MKFGVHYGYWVQNWEADIPSFVKKAAQIGFDTLEISGNALLELSDDEVKNLAETAHRENIIVTACHGMSQQTDTGSLDTAVRQKGREVLSKMFGKLDLLGSKQLGGILYSWWPTLGFMAEKEAIAPIWQQSVAEMKSIADEANDHGITLTLEVVNRYENFLFNDTAGALQYLDAVGKNNVKLLLDCYHMNIEEDYLGDAIRLAGGKLGHFHIGECNRKVPGSGHMPWDDMAQGLRDIGYDGIVVMEPFVQKGGEVADSIRVWRDLAQTDEASLDREIKGALAFIKEKFAV